LKEISLYVLKLNPWPCDKTFCMSTRNILPCHKKWIHVAWKYFYNIVLCDMEYPIKILCCSLEPTHRLMFTHQRHCLSWGNNKMWNLNQLCFKIPFLQYSVDSQISWNDLWSWHTSCSSCKSNQWVESNCKFHIVWSWGRLKVLFAIYLLSICHL
jgi:hypothetical protein